MAQVVGEVDPGGGGKRGGPVDEAAGMMVPAGGRRRGGPAEEGVAGKIDTPGGNPEVCGVGSTSVFVGVVTRLPVKCYVIVIVLR